MRAREKEAATELEGDRGYRGAEREGEETQAGEGAVKRGKENFASPPKWIEVRGYGPVLVG